MAFTIQEVLRPIFVMCFIIGISAYPTKQPKPEIQKIIYLRIVYSLILWLAYGYLFYYTMTMFTLKELYQSAVGVVVSMINIVIIITSVIMSLYNQKRLQMCMMKLTAVDNTLEKLGTPKIYQKMHTLSKRVVIGWIIYSLTLNVYNITWWIHQKEISFWRIVLSYISNHCINMNILIDLLFITLLWHIGIRFDKVNEHVRCLLVKKDHQLTCTWEKPSVTFLHRYMWNYKQTLWTSMHLHTELCRIAREINLIFGVQMTFEMLSYLLYITLMCDYFYLKWKHQIEMSTFNLNYNMFNIIVSILTFFIRLCIINLICENVSTKANQIVIVIHQLTDILRYDNVWKEIYQFALQTIQQPLRFNGMGLFRFGNVFVLKFCTTVLAFVIITIQMKIYVKT